MGPAAQGFSFELLGRDPATGARRGRLTLPGGAQVETPAFMPVGTQATAKAVGCDDLERLGYRLILGNTYHLMLRPGLERLRAAGGLKRFMGWGGGVLTDSGGFQVFSLAARRRITAGGIEFASHLDGSTHFLSPERAIELQEGFGSDIAMALDVCPPGTAGREEIQRAMDLTTAWLGRCLAARRHPPAGQPRATDQAPAQPAEVHGSALFGIIQGGVHEDLRRAHAAAITALPCEGYAIGGVSVGEEQAAIAATVALTAPLLPADRPRYLMGVGTLADISAAVAAGVDLFDCVLPTRNARNGQLITAAGPLNIKRAEYAADLGPIEEGCECLTCTRHSRAYLRHLHQAKELLYYRLASLHNLACYQRHLAGLRARIPLSGPGS